MPNQLIRVLLVEDNDADAHLLKEYLQESRFGKFEVTIVDSMFKTKEALEKNEFDVVVLDLNLPDTKGPETFFTTKPLVKDSSIIVLTSTDNEELALEALKNGAQDYQLKNSVGNKEFPRVVRYAFERKKIQEELRKKTEELEIQTWGLKKTNEGIKALYKELENKNKKLEQLDSMKDNFISNVSHELRTPLTIIKESVNIVFDGTTGPINAEQKDFLESAKMNVERLGRLINDVLDYQKIDAGAMKFKMEKQSINEVVKEVSKGFKVVLDKQNVVLNLKIDENLPNILFDRDKIIQVLTNLINNAVKFTEKGAISLITEKLGENAIKISVKDSGIGIKEEDLDKLFKSFSQISTGMGRKTGGTGLGLVLCRKIMEAHHGKISVESVFGQGSVFYFVLPIEERRTRGAGV